MKSAVKTGLMSGCLFGAAWVAFISPAFIAFAVMGYLVQSIAAAAALFALSGLPFGLAMGMFDAYQTRRFLEMSLVPDDETLVHQGGANHFVGLEGVGGWLYLTDHALRFESHEFNIQRHELAIPLKNISEALACRTAWIFPNGLVINTDDGRSERFVVAGRRTWSNAITRAKMATAK